MSLSSPGICDPVRAFQRERMKTGMPEPTVFLNPKLASAFIRCGPDVERKTRRSSIYDFPKVHLENTGGENRVVMVENLCPKFSGR